MNLHISIQFDSETMWYKPKNYDFFWCQVGHFSFDWHVLLPPSEEFWKQEQNTSSNMCLMRCCHHFPKHMVSNFGVEYSWLTHKLPPEANIFRYTYLDRQRNDHLVFYITSSVFGWATSILSIVSLSNGGTLEDFRKILVNTTPH